MKINVGSIRAQLLSDLFLFNFDDRSTMDWIVVTLYTLSM